MRPDIDKRGRTSIKRADLVDGKKIRCVVSKRTWLNVTVSCVIFWFHCKLKEAQTGEEKKSDKNKLVFAYVIRRRKVTFSLTWLKSTNFRRDKLSNNISRAKTFSWFTFVDQYFASYFKNTILWRNFSPANFSTIKVLVSS